MNEQTSDPAVRIVANDDRIAPADLGALLGRANDTPYDLETVANEKCYGEGATGAPTRLLAFVGEELAGAAVVSSGYLRILAVSPSFRHRGVGSLLLGEAERIGANQHRRLVVGGEPGNYFVPGVLESDSASLSFFSKRGYQKRDVAQNLEAVLAARDPRPMKVPVTRARLEEREEVLAYIRREFGRLWAFEVTPAFSDPHCPLFVARSDRELIGFSAHDVNNRGLGFYGPAGVTKSWRGGGIGALLLEASLEDLRRRGYHRVIIPWVSSIEFYARIAEAKPSHRFVGMSKEF